MIDQVGRQLGNYKLLRLLGKGGFAEVYLGEHVYLKSLAAIKVLLTPLGSNDASYFVSEARILMGLRHPHIVRVLEFGVERDTPFLVMDYAPNGTLRQRYPKGTRLSPAVVATYVRQTASALQYAHNQKFIHRDVKPENLLFQHDDEILLSDFGIALIAQTHQSNQGFIGTATYMAPEQIRGKATIASDQYSLGIIAYEWLSGIPPFQGSFTEVCAQHILTPPTPLHDTVPTLSPDIEHVIMTALAKEPQRRFASVETFAIALQQACQIDSSDRTMPIATHSNEWEHTLIKRPEYLAQQLYPLSSQDRDFVQLDKPLDTKNPTSTTNNVSSTAHGKQFSTLDGRDGFVPQPMQQRALQRRTLPMRFATLLIILVITLIGGGLGFLTYTFSYQSHLLTPTPRVSATSQDQPAPTTAPQPTSPPAQPSPTAAPQPTNPPAQPSPTAAPQPVNQPGGVLTLNDSLSAQSANQWSVFSYAGNVGGCNYANHAYHVTIKQAGSFSTCMAQATNFANFTYQVNMTLLSGTSGDGGGLIFRSASGKAYRFRVGIDGSFDLVDDAHSLVSSSNSAIKTGPNQTNVLMVKAQGSSISLFVNKVQIAKLDDSFSSSGAIGVFAVDFTQPVDAAFSNAQVWR